MVAPVRLRSLRVLILSALFLQSTVEKLFSSTSNLGDADARIFSVEEARQYGIPREGEDISVRL